MMNKISTDSMICLWNSTRIPRRALRHALRSVGMEDFMPSRCKFDALEQACREVVTTCKLGDDADGIKYEALAGGKGRLEVVRKRKSSKRNTFDHLFSAGLTLSDSSNKDSPPIVEVLSADPIHVPLIAQNIDAAEEDLNNAFTTALATVSATSLTECLVRVLKSSMGVSLKKGGGVYIVPRTFCDKYLLLQQNLAAHGPNLVASEAELSVNPELCQHVSEQIIEEIAEGLERMRSKVDDLNGRKGKRRSNGDKTRFQQLSGYMEKIKAYENILSLPVADLKAAIEETKNALGLEAFYNGVM